MAKQGSAMLKRISFLSVLTLFFGCLALYLGQDNTWDARDYHFYNGYAALQGRLMWDFAPAMIQTYLNPVFDVVNYLLISNFNASWVGIAHGALTGITLYCVFLIAELVFQTTTFQHKIFYAFIAILIGATSSDNLATLGLITNDSKVALLVISSLYFYVRYIQSSRLTDLVLASLLVGFCTAFKLTTAIYCIAAVIAFIFTCRSLKPLFIVVATISLAFLLGNGYWMVKLYHNFQSPLFPYYNNVFHSPFAPFFSGSDKLYYPHDYLIFPFLVGFYKTTTVEHLRELRFALVYVLLILFLCKQYFTQISVAKEQKFLLTWFVTGYIIWFCMFTIFRYALPLELMSGVVILILLDYLFHSVKIKSFLILLFLISLLSTTVPTRFGRLPYQQNYYFTNPPALPDDSVVFLQGAPLAYVIPFFNKTTHFVGATNMINTNRLDKVVRSNSKKIYLLRKKTAKITTSDYNKFLQNNYALLVDEKCQSFTTNIGDNLELCGTHSMGEND